MQHNAERLSIALQTTVQHNQRRVPLCSRPEHPVVYESVSMNCPLPEPTPFMCHEGLLCPAANWCQTPILAREIWVIISSVRT